MAEIQTYPSGTPVTGDVVPYVSDPAGTPALKLADISAFSGGGGAGNPWGLFAPDGSTTVDEEFDGLSGLSWTDAVPASGSGHATWTEGNDVLGVSFGGQSSGAARLHLTSHALAVGEAVETAVTLAGPNLAGGFAGLAVTDGTTGSSNIILAGLFNSSGFNCLMRDGTIDAVTSGINVFYGLITSNRIRMRVKRTATNTYRFEMSINGLSWFQLGADQTWANTPTHVGVAVSSWGVDTTTYGDLVASFEYVRVA